MPSGAGLTIGAGPGQGPSAPVFDAVVVGCEAVADAPQNRLGAAGMGVHLTGGSLASSSELVMFTVIRVTAS
jgi:hypothetical protein